jgi:hypothetical protein
VLSATLCPHVAALPSSDSSLGCCPLPSLRLCSQAHRHAVRDSENALIPLPAAEGTYVTGRPHRSGLQPAGAAGLHPHAHAAGHAYDPSTFSAAGEAQSAALAAAAARHASPIDAYTAVLASLYGIKPQPTAPAVPAGPAAGESPAGGHVTGSAPRLHSAAPDSPAPAAAFAAAGLHESYLAALHAARVSERF